MPGVVETSYASSAPWAGRNPTELAEIDGRPFPPTGDYRRDPVRRQVSPGYFAVLDLPIVRGRGLTAGDGTTAPVLPAVISEAMARRYWPGQDPLGHRFRAGRIHEVVGVSRDVQSLSYMQDDGPIYYPPIDAHAAKPAFLLVRVGGDPQGPAGGLRDVVRRIDPQMATTTRTLASIVEREGERLKPVAIYGAAAGVLALLLALSGVYGVVSLSVSQRAREIGIRLALGAQRRDIVALVLRSGTVPVCVGLAAGIALCLAAARVTAALQAGSNGRDPAILTIVALLLLAAASGAVLIPARRAASVDPLASVRHE
jgi:hypothetical protein